MDTLLGILAPIEWAVSWIMVQFHSLFVALGLNTDGGWTWALSIVGLVVVIRILLIPLFVKQIRSQRGLQLLQPQIKELQKKYKNDRERQSQELMKLYRETKTNPLASCLPILAQAPIFFGLFRVLNEVARGRGLGFLSDKPDLVQSARDAELFGAPISSTFLRAGGFDNPAAVQIVSAVLIVLMSASMFITQKQLMTKNMPAASLEGPFAQQQKILLYLFPVIFLVTGVNFPIGVLIYWFTTNVWSMFQQLYVIARMPAPGSVAEARLEAKRAARAAKRGGAPTPSSSDAAPGPDTSAGTVTQPAPPVRGQRQQPKRQPRGKRQSPGPRRGPSAPSSGPGSPGTPGGTASGGASPARSTEAGPARPDPTPRGGGAGKGSAPGKGAGRGSGSASRAGAGADGPSKATPVRGASALRTGRTGAGKDPAGPSPTSATAKRPE